MLPAIIAAAFCLVPVCYSQEAKPQQHPSLIAADHLLQSSNFSEAIQKYQRILKSDPTLIPVNGISGEVSKTYSADKATLQFGNIREPNQDIVAFDLSGISKDLGVEVSGFLGFSTFRQLEMKIDYRDGLVEFIYDPSKLPPALRP